MFQQRNSVMVMALCAALGACDGASKQDLTDPSAETLDIGSANLLANSWAAKRQLPTALYSAKAAAINNLIYVVGGNGSCCTIISRVDAYNVTTNTWSARQPLPSPRTGLNGVSVINGKLYVAGGYDGAGAYTRTLYVYTPGTNTWVKKANMPHVGACGAQGVISGMLYVYAACSSIGAYRNLLYRYNPATNTWVTLAPPPVHYRGESGVIGGKFYLAGGVISADKLHVYDPATNSWTAKAPMPAPANDMAGAVLNGKLYVAGGEALNTGAPLATLRVYTPATNTWTTKAPLPATQVFAAGAAAGGRFFVMGGFENDAAIRRVVAYTP
jgi:N-acetylneuraminic acid mutarotase